MESAKKDKLITMRVSEETRSKAHEAALGLHGKSLSNYLSKKIQLLIEEYEYAPIKTNGLDTIEVPEVKRPIGRPRKHLDAEMVVSIIDI